jgi:ribosomal protein S8
LENKLTRTILLNLIKEGFIYSLTFTNNEYYVYFNYNIPLFGIHQISKAGNRTFYSAAKLRYNNDIWGLISTKRGIITFKEAKKLNLGGEVLVAFNFI